MKAHNLFPTAILFAAFSHPLLADDTSGFYLGGGAFSAQRSNCDICDYSANFIEFGYDINRILSVEAKIAKGKNNSNDAELLIGFTGINIGHDLNTGWFRLYGKIGFASIYEEGLNYCTQYSRYTACYTQEDYQSTGLTAGVGMRANPSGKTNGIYVKAESMAVTYTDDSVGAAFMIGAGYKF